MTATSHDHDHKDYHDSRNHGGHEPWQPQGIPWWPQQWPWRPQPWRPQAMTMMATRYTMMATAMKTWRSNDQLLRNRQIRSEFSVTLSSENKISPSYVFGRHGLWPSWLVIVVVMVNGRYCCELHGWSLAIMLCGCHCRTLPWVGGHTPNLSRLQWVLGFVELQSFGGRWWGRVCFSAGDCVYYLASGVFAQSSLHWALPLDSTLDFCSPDSSSRIHFFTFFENPKNVTLRTLKWHLKNVKKRNPCFRIMTLLWNNYTLYIHHYIKIVD